MIKSVRCFVLFVMILFVCLPVSAQRVLMVVTSCDQLEGMKDATGYWGEELVVPFHAFRDAGFAVDIASPKGGTPPIDAKSLDEHTKKTLAQQPLKRKIKNTIPLILVKAENYDAVFVVGGHGVLGDLVAGNMLGAKELARILHVLAKRKKYIAAVCHGPAALVNVKIADGKYLLDGHTVSGFSNDEEAALEGLSKVVINSPLKGLLADRLNISSNGNYEQGSMWAPFARVCGNIVTGQNPASSEVTAKALVGLLQNNYVMPNGIVLCKDKDQTSEFKQNIKEIKMWISEQVSNGNLEKFAGKFDHSAIFTILDKPIDLSKGHTTFYIGTRKSEVSKEKFMAGLIPHVVHVSEGYVKMGVLNAYLVITDGNYEIAVMNWTSEQEMYKAFQSPIGQQGQKEAQALMDNLAWEPFAE